MYTPGLYGVVFEIGKDYSVIKTGIIIAARNFNIVNE